MSREEFDDVHPALAVVVDLHDSPVAEADLTVDCGLPEHLAESLDIEHPLVSLGIVEDLGSADVSDGVSDHPLGDLVLSGEVGVYNLDVHTTIVTQKDSE